MFMTKFLDACYAAILKQETSIENTIAAADDEYTFRIDKGTLSSGQIYNIYLPTISAVDRRLYYFKVTDINATATGGQIRLNPVSGGSAQPLADIRSRVLD